jgi:hypothetical protein
VFGFVDLLLNQEFPLRETGAFIHVAIDSRSDSIFDHAAYWRNPIWIRPLQLRLEKMRFNRAPGWTGMPDRRNVICELRERF